MMFYGFLRWCVCFERSLLTGSSLGIEFLLNEMHGQIGPLCLNERSDYIQY